jgi:hypothetical protein
VVHLLALRGAGLHRVIPGVFPVLFPAGIARDIVAEFPLDFTENHRIVGSQFN